MARKRKRSAYTALSSATVLRYQPHHTSRTRTSTTLHVTPAPPESITEFDSSQPSPQTPTSTPLVLRASDIASVQLALGFTPDTPANSVVYLGPDEQQHARALIDSPQHLPAYTPRAPRRLSLGSTVTPIPLHLESPDKHSATESPPVPTPVHHPQAPPLLPPQQPLPSPITPHHHTQYSSPPVSQVVRSSSPEERESDGLLDAAPLSVKKLVKVTHTPNATTLFTTGTGKPLAPPNNNLTTPPKPESHPAPLFTTGKGKPLAPINSKRLPKASIVLNQPNNLVRSLFSTGKGKPVHIPKSVNPPSTTLRTPLADKTNVPSLFTTGTGKRVSVSSNARMPTILHQRPPPSPNTPSIPENVLRKALFPDSDLPLNKKQPAPTGMTLRSSAGKSLQRRQSRSILKTTPFRHPRRIASSKEEAKIARTSVGNPLIPRWKVSQLSKSGLIWCESPSHQHHHTPTRLDTGQLVSRITNFLIAPNCLQSCLQFVFEKNAFGAYDCLPGDVVQHFQFRDLASFSVGNVLSWTRALFPTVVEKPASCFGSAAWTRMSYSLAIWKLAKLQNDGYGRNKFVSFLTAANSIREILRRIDTEWHANRQPHLLRIMRKDSSPASHVVLILSGFELEAESTLFVILSDGWYLARAVVDETIEKRIWSGQLRIGDKVGVVGASLQERDGSRPFFFGDADELGASMFRLCANGVRKVPNSFSRLGRHPSPWSGSLRWVKDDGGKCPILKVIILRSYPVFYMEALSSVGAEEIEQRQFKSRRAEGEDQAQAIYQEKVRAKLQTEVDHRNDDKNNTAEMQDTEQRDVRIVKEVLVCGINDDPAATSARKLLRVYNVSETLQAWMSKEGDLLLLSQVIPKKSGWTCKPEGVRHAAHQKTVKALGSDVLRRFPRRLYSVPELRSGAVVPNDDFDGVFLILYVTSDSSNRFAYLTSAPADDINILALQLSDTDSECLPRALQFKQGLRLRFPVIGIRDAKYCYRDSKLDILHAKSTMRTSFLMSRSLNRMPCSHPLRKTYDYLESRVRGKEPQLEVLRDAVISFASGNRSSVSAYFTSTPDM